MSTFARNILIALISSSVAIVLALAFLVGG
jgi:hypothetical protein